jgi:hypothetical protein
MKWILLAGLLVATASAQTFTAGPLIEVSTTNLFAACAAGTPGFVPNSEVEPCLAVNPLNPDHLIGVWQQDRFSDGGSRGNVVGVSTNGGATWHLRPLTGLVLCDDGEFQRATDPWISFAPDGTAHLIALALDADTNLGFGRNAMLACRSVDGGFTWSAPVTLIETNHLAVFNDKETITADPTDPNLVYAVWDRIEPYKKPGVDFTGPTVFTRSTDGGLTWEPARAINRPGKFKQTIGNQIVVLPDGTLLNVAAYIRALKQGRARNAIVVQRSFDRGVTWEKLRRVIRTQPRSGFDANRISVFDPESHQEIRTGEVLPAVAVDRVTGMIYVAWQDSRFSDNGFDEVAFAQSADGRKWSKPIKINLTPAQGPGPNRQAFNPSIRVAGDGTVCVTWYDFRNNNRNVTPPLSTDVWAAFCKPADGIATNWVNEVRLTDASFDMLEAPNAFGYFVGDYQGLVAAGNDFLAFWSQPHSNDPASIFARRLTPVP